MTVTIRVRLNPADGDEYVIYADTDDDRQRWIGQRSGGRWTGWEYGARVAHWPEFELAIPDRADPDPECPGSP